MSEAALLASLQRLVIESRMHEHPAVFTVEESADLHRRIPGLHTKNLFLKDAGGAYWLVTARHDLAVDLKALAMAVGAKKFSFGKAGPMEDLLGVTPGAVTPLAAINDAAGSVRVVLDRALADAAQVNVHPLRNTATLALSGVDLCRALADWGHEPMLVDIPERA